jgi:hypothetical protein
MNFATIIHQRGRALLIQTMERRWPRCGAHTKRNQVSRRDELVWSGLLAPELQREIRAFVDGWEEAIAAAGRILQEAAPFEDAGLPEARRAEGGQRPDRGRRVSNPAAQGVPRRDHRAAEALAGLESLFSEAGGADHEHAL